MRSCCERLVSAGINPEVCDCVIAAEMQGPDRHIREVRGLQRARIRRAQLHYVMKMGPDGQLSETQRAEVRRIFQRHADMRDGIMSVTVG